MDFEQAFPIYKVEYDAIISKQGDITLAFEATLPEIFTLSDQEYEAFHQTLVKAIRMLPQQTVFHKQDWFVAQQHRAAFENNQTSMLSRASERFFNERPHLNHTCQVMLTRKPANRKPSSSVFSNLIRKTLVPEETLNSQRMQEFLDSAAQFSRILKDSGFMNLRQLSNNELAGTKDKPGAFFV